MARPEIEPKTQLAERLREVRRHVGDPDRGDVAKRLEISLTALSTYERGEREPSASVLAAYSRCFGVNLHWLLTGHGSMFIGGDVQVENVTLAEVRKYVWNIAATFWEKLPRRTRPEQVADQFVEMLDYLVTRQNVNDGAASEVIRFGAERLRKSSSRDAG